MSSATYVYAVVAADIDLPEGLTPVGGGEEVAVIDHGRLAAVVSDVPRDAPLGSREDLLAHERTVNTLAGSTTVLPMRFGGVVDDDRAVVDELLAAHQEYFTWALEQLDGCRQFVLAGRYDQDRLVAGIVEADREIQQLGEAVRGKDPDATYYERIRLGEAIAGHVERIRSDDADFAVERLGPFAVATSVKEPAAEDGAVELALLVHRDRVGDFEQAVDALGDEWDERVRLRLIGPVAPYDFLPEPPEAEG